MSADVFGVRLMQVGSYRQVYASTHLIGVWGKDLAFGVHMECAVQSPVAVFTPEHALWPCRVTGKRL